MFARIIATLLATLLLIAPVQAADQKESALSTVTPAAANTVTGLQGGVNVNFSFTGISNLFWSLISGDCTIASGGAITCTKTNSVAFATSATTDTTVATNISSGTLPAGRMPALTGDVTTSAGAVATTIATNIVTNAKAAQGGANTMKGNWTGSTANEADNVMPSCADSGSNHLSYVSGTGITCGTANPGVSLTSTTANIVVGGTATAPTLTATAPINPQSGTSYTVVTVDNTKLVTLSNASAIAVTLPQAGSAGFLTGWSNCYSNLGAGTATITTTTSTINGSGQTLILTTGMGACLASDGTNWEGLVTLPKPASGATTYYKGDGTQGTPAGSGTVTVVGAGTLTSGAMVTGGGSQTLQTDNSITASAGALSLGASGTAGSAAFGNATSGTITLQPVTGALGSVTASLPANTGIIAELNINQTWTKAQAVSPSTLTDAATVTVDASLSNVFTLTLGGNRTLGAPTNTIAGQTMIFEFTQDGTGSRTLAYNAAYKFPSGTAPVLTTTAAARDDMSCVVVTAGGSPILDCVSNLKFQ